jgi:hypothetical protein
VLVDGASSQNILFLKPFDKMGLHRSALRPSRAPFHGVVPGAVATPVSQITLAITYGTRKKYCIEYTQFVVANFETAYNAFLGRPALTNFMATPNGAISIKGDVKQAYNYDQESYESADALMAFIELQNLKKAIVECPRRLDPVMPEVKTSKLSIQLEDKLNKTGHLFPSDRSKVMHIGNNLDHK